MLVVLLKALSSVTWQVPWIRGFVVKGAFVMTGNDTFECTIVDTDWHCWLLVWCKISTGELLLQRGSSKQGLLWLPLNSLCVMNWLSPDKSLTSYFESKLCSHLSAEASWFKSLGRNGLARVSVRFNSSIRRLESRKAWSRACRVSSIFLVFERQWAHFLLDSASISTLISGVAAIDRDTLLTDFADFPWNCSLLSVS